MLIRALAVVELEDFHPKSLARIKRLLSEAEGSPVPETVAELVAAAESMTEDETRDSIMEALGKKAKDGDAAAARAYIAMTERKAPEDRFNIELNIVPYTVQDKSVPMILFQADTEVVDGALAGLLQRLESDGAPAGMIKSLSAFKASFLTWADVTYTPKDDLVGA